MSPSRLRISLTMLGCLLPGVAQADPGDPPPPGIPELEEGLEQGAALTQDATWAAMLPIWQEAAAIGAGERGPHPFDRAGKDALLTQLETSKLTVDGLQAGGLLSAPEAGLLKADVDALILAVGKKRPTEMEGATCYRPMMVVPMRDSGRRLEQRLPLLEQLATQGTLNAAVVERVLTQIEADIAVVAETGGGPGMTATDMVEIRETAERAQAQVTIVRAKLEDAE